MGVQLAGGISGKTGGRVVSIARQIGFNGWAGSGAQSGPAAVLFDLDLTEIGEIIDDALPFELAAACRQTICQFLAQHQGEEGAEDVAADAGIGFVEDRPGGKQRFCGFEGVHADAGEAALTAFEESFWGQKYPAIGQSWRRAWGEVVPFYAFPGDVRRILCTTNAIEALNSKLRRAVRARGH